MDINKNVLVIGLGSMGKRRIRLIKELYPSVVLFGVDQRKDRRDETEKIFHIKTYKSISDCANSNNIEIALVCTSPLSHYRIINECLINQWDVFTELNLVKDGYEENIALAEKENKVLFLSSTFLYRDEIRFLLNRISEEVKWNYSYHVSQYLPDWHPWECYSDYFIGEKQTNGCREIFAIELPWIISTFGKIKSTSVIADKMTHLDIDFKDNYIVQIEHENGNKGCLIVDVVSPIAERMLEVYSENKYYRWNGTPDSLFEYNYQNKKMERVVPAEVAEHQEGYSRFIIENMYKNEIKAFFDMVEGRVEKEMYGFRDDINTISLIDKIENSAGVL